MKELLIQALYFLSPDMYIWRGNPMVIIKVGILPASNAIVLNGTLFKSNSSNGWLIRISSGNVVSKTRPIMVEFCFIKWIDCPIVEFEYLEANGTAWKRWRKRYFLFLLCLVLRVSKKSKKSVEVFKSDMKCSRVTLYFVFRGPQWEVPKNKNKRVLPFGSLFFYILQPTMRCSTNPICQSCYKLHIIALILPEQ